MTLASLNSPNYTGADLSTRVNAILVEARSGRRFPSPAAVLADTTMAYSSGKRPVAAGDRVVTADGFAYEVALSASTNHHLATAGGVKLKALMTPAGAFTVRQFGGRENSDISVPLQLAIDAAAYGVTPGVDGLVGHVLIDVVRATVSRTIHLGYGATGGVNEFRRVAVRGLGKSYSTDTKHMSTRILSMVTNAPTFAIQSGRTSQISDLGIVGPATAALNALDWTGPGVTQEATWDAALVASGVTPNRRYAPQAAIAIDPYAGVQPAEPYPDVTFPSYIDATPSQYGKGGSTKTLIERVDIRGFEVGIAQTPSDWDINGDFLTIRDCDIRCCKWGVSVGNSQARTTSGYDTLFGMIWCHITNNRHGKRSGTLSGVWESCGFFGFVGKLFEVADTATAGGLHYQNTDIESLHRIGDIAGSSSNDKEILFTNTMIKFRHADLNMVPANVLSAPVTTVRGGPVRFTSGEIAGYPSTVSMLGLEIVVDGTTLLSSEAQAKTYEKIAHNATQGGLVIPFIAPATQEARFEPFNLDTGSGLGSRLAVGSGYRYTGRKYLAPLFAGPMLREDDYLYRAMVGPRPHLYNSDLLGTHITGAVREGRTVTFQSTQIANHNVREQGGYMPGDVIRDRATGTVMIIRSTDVGTSTIVAELQTNWRLNGAGYDLVDESFSLASGEWEFACARVYAASKPLVGTTSTTAATISGVVNTQGTAPGFGLAVGDMLFEDVMPVPTFLTTGRFVIAGTDTAAGTITMGGNAARTLADWAFDWWIRAAPPNEPVR